VVVGTLAVIGDFRVTQVEFTVSTKYETTSYGHQRHHHWRAVAAEDGRSHEVSHGVYDTISVGEHVRCTGPNMPVLGTGDLIRCERLANVATTASALASSTR
jgi:hypothetical protein